MGALAPGEHALFAMVMHVPRDAWLGRNFFDWILAPDTYEPAWEMTPVFVEP